MPVLGHAVVGWVLAEEFRPRVGPGVLSGRTAGAFWTPALIATAFLPDISSQLLAIAGVADPTDVTHSFAVCAVEAALLALAFRRVAGLGLFAATLLAALLLPGHVVMDLLQSPWRSPWWPLSSSPLPLPAALLPRRAFEEALLSAISLVAFLLFRRLRRTPAAPPLPASPLATAATAVIVGLAALTHHLRSEGEDRYFLALRHLDAGDPAAALRLADEADRWPRPTRPGRLDYIRAEAHRALGEDEVAEGLFVRSLREDPDYFWARADLCLLYATAQRPREERRARASPCLDELKSRFGEHPDLPRMAAKAERALLSEGRRDDPRSPEPSHSASEAENASP